jgi:topoisomerase-4 subunit B
MENNAKSEYSDSSIKVLKGLEPVKQRPGMYTRTENPLHICQEVIDNAADEALGGYAKSIEVTVHADGSLSVRDDGRGIPVGIHPEEGIPTVEVVFTRLHAGGKFNKESGDGAYSFSGGLHGVGVSVTNALANRLEVEVTRDGGVHRLVFSNGDVIEQLSRVGAADDGLSGTRVRVWPNAKYFDSEQIPFGELERLLRSKAILLPGLRVVLANEKLGTQQEWIYEDGLKGYLEAATFDVESVTPVLAGERYVGSDDEAFAMGEGAAWALRWVESGNCARESYVNLIPTPHGGTHESGMRDGVFNAVRNFAEVHSMMPKGVKLVSDDVTSRMSFVVSAKVLDPQFQGQVKEKLNNRDAVRLVSQSVRDPLELWLNDHVDVAKLIVDLAINAAQTRMRSLQKVEKKKSSGIAVLPGKLTDCESQDLARNELFLVEGDSAGGSAKMGRDKDYQAVLPLRGKVLNTWETEPDRLFANNEIHDMAVAMGVDPHSSLDADLSGLRYGKIIILSDADVDGSHIQVLLLTLFLRHFPTLIVKGHIYVGQPPLFRVDIPGSGKKRQAKKLYALDSHERDSIIEKATLEGVDQLLIAVSRFKGLGEMNAEQLWETTLDPQTRRLIRVESQSEGDALLPKFTMLMAKGEAAGRRMWMEQNGNLVEADI